MKTPKEYFSDKSAEQIFSLCLLVACVALMLFCAIVRLCGGLWFSADLSKVKVPSKTAQDIIMALLLIFELTFVYKLLCRCNWFTAIAISVVHTTISAFIPTELWTNIFHIVCYIIVPLIFVRDWKVIIDSIILYLFQLLYASLFLIGRIGDLDIYSGYNFLYSVLGSIDYKLFIVSFYLFIKYFGGIRLWKKQKRLILQKDLKMKKA